MQIFPTLSDMHRKEASFASKDNGRDSFGFSQLLSKHFENTPAEITPDLSDSSLSNETPGYLFATEAPYDSIDESNVDISTLYTPTSIDDIRFTDSELQHIADSLEKQGVSSESVQELMGSPNGATVSDVIQSIAYEEPIRFSESDIIQIRNLANEVDASGELGESMLEDLRQGRTLQAWNRFITALSGQNPDKNLSIKHSEIVSLGKVLGVNSATLDALSKSFQGSKELLLNADALKNLLVPLQQEMTNKLDTQTNLVSKLEAALMPTIKEARKRMDEEAAAAGLESKRAQQSQTLIQDTVTKAGLSKIQSKEIVDQNPNGVQLKEGINTGVSLESVKDSSQSNNEPFHGNEGKNNKDNNGLFEKNNDHQSKNLFADTHKSSVTSNPWEALAQRLGINQSIGTIIPTQQSVQAQNVQTPLDRLASRMVSQIEQGIFSSLRNGTSRLELTINPLDIGNVNILLTTKNGEISALLRPERPETTAALMQQLDSLRAELEQQGLKVDKVEVQTQLKDDQGMHWQSMDQHNASQEQFARAKDLERLRILGRIDRKDENIETSLAHNLQDNTMLGMSSRLDLIA